jgi:hypothetical protein
MLATVAAAQGAAATDADPAWSVEGQWADACNCQAPCPCWKREVPTAGDCGDLFYFHIEKGHYGELKLDGLDVVQIFKTAGGKSMAQSRKDKDVAIANTYTSKDQSPAVAAALETIFLRLSPTQLPSAKLHATKRVEFAATMGPERVAIEIPGVLTVDLKATKDASGKPIPFPYSMKAIPWTVGPAVQAESVVYNFNDDGVSWEIKQRHATFARFAYSSDRGPLPWEPGFSQPPAAIPAPSIQ